MHTHLPLTIFIAKRPQAKHKPKSRSSQHDKRKRLETPNPRQKQTVKAKVPLTGKMAVLVTSMTGMLATLPGTLNLRKFKTLIKDVISLCT